MSCAYCKRLEVCSLWFNNNARTWEQEEELFRTGCVNHKRSIKRFFYEMDLDLSIAFDKDPFTVKD